MNKDPLDTDTLKEFAQSIVGLTSEELDAVITDCRDEIMDLERSINHAKSEAFTKRKFMDPTDFGEMNDLLKFRKLQVNMAQAAIGRTNRAKVSGLPNAGKVEPLFALAFLEVCRTALDKETYRAIADKAERLYDDQKENPVPVPRR